MAIFYNLRDQHNHIGAAFMIADYLRAGGTFTDKERDEDKIQEVCNLKHGLQFLPET